MFLGEVTVVLRLDLAAVVGFHITTSQNPIAAESGETFFGGAFEVGVAPRAGAIIDAHRLVFLDAAVERLGVGEGDLAHRHADLRVELALDVNAGGSGKLGE